MKNVKVTSCRDCPFCIYTYMGGIEEPCCYHPELGGVLKGVFSLLKVTPEPEPFDYMPDDCSLRTQSLLIEADSESI